SGQISPWAFGSDSLTLPDGAGRQGRARRFSLHIRRLERPPVESVEVARPSAELRVCQLVQADEALPGAPLTLELSSLRFFLLLLHNEKWPLSLSKLDPPRPLQGLRLRTHRRRKSCGLAPRSADAAGANLTWATWLRARRDRLPQCGLGDLAEGARWFIPCGSCGAPELLRLGASRAGGTRAAWPSSRPPTGCGSDSMEFGSVRVRARDLPGYETVRELVIGEQGLESDVLGQVVFLGDSTLRGLMFSLFHIANGSLNRWEKSHDTLTLMDRDGRSRMDFSYYPQFWLPGSRATGFRETLRRILLISQNGTQVEPAAAFNRTVIVIGGAQWLTGAELLQTRELLGSLGLQVPVIVKDLSPGFHIRVPGVTYKPLTVDTARELSNRNSQLHSISASLGFSMLPTFRLSAARYREFHPGKCACHFHTVTPRQRRPGRDRGFEVDGDIHRTCLGLLTALLDSGLPYRVSLGCGICPECLRRHCSDAILSSRARSTGSSEDTFFCASITYSASEIIELRSEPAAESAPLFGRRCSGSWLSSRSMPGKAVRAAETGNRNRRPARSTRRSGLIQRALDQAKNLRAHRERARASRAPPQQPEGQTLSGEAPTDWFESVTHQEAGATRIDLTDEAEGTGSDSTEARRGGDGNVHAGLTSAEDSTATLTAEDAETPMEINLQHCVAASVNLMRYAELDKPGLILVQEPWTLRGKPQNAPAGYNCFYTYPREANQPPRACIFASKTLSAWLRSDLSNRDICVIQSEDLLPGKTTLIASNFIYAAEQWADRCGLRLSETKTAAIMFTSRTKWQIRPLTLYGREIPFCKQTKCLGITLDHRLNWSPHVQTKAKKAFAVLAQLRRAVGTTWGLTPKRLWWIYTAMVRPAISYGGLIWASALQIKTCLEALRRAQGRACRTIMSAPPSAPYDGLNAFLNIPPLDIFVRREAAKTARRLADAGIRIQPHRAMAKRKLLPHADLCLKDLRDSGGLHVLSDGEPRTLNLFQRYKVTIPSRDAANDHWNFQEVHCYTDGSIKDGRAGFGVCIIINGRVIATHAQHTGRLSTVFQNEVLAISSCAAELNAKVTRGKTIVIHSDSQAALQALCHTTTNSRTVADCARQLNLLARSNTVRLKWIPGHAGFPGNELADTLAKRGGSGSFFGPAPLVPMPLTVINRQIDDWADSLHRDRWAGTQNCRQSRAAVPCPSHRLRNILLNQNRKDIRALVMTLTGHGYLARHCFLRGDLESEICPFCECDNEDAQHFVCHCPFFNRDRLRYLGPNPSIDEVCQPDSIPRLIQFLRATRRATAAAAASSSAISCRCRSACGANTDSGLRCHGRRRRPVVASTTSPSPAGRLSSCRRRCAELTALGRPPLMAGTSMTLSDRARPDSASCRSACRNSRLRATSRRSSTARSSESSRASRFDSISARRWAPSIVCEVFFCSLRRLSVVSGMAWVAAWLSL
uniref:RNase H domain-containing protein n=1 Tax=Macrostomum lignano TaxID=282301 RepID=A0A1I8IR31_9PLAT